MKPNSVLRLKHLVWAVCPILVAVLLLTVARSRAKPNAQAVTPPIVEVALVEQRDIPVYREWIGTLAGQVNADIRAQVTGYLLARNYKEGSHVRKGQLLFEIDPRQFQAALDQAKGQLARAQAQLVQDEAQLATARANELKSQLDVEKYAPLAKAEAVSQQDFDDATQTNLANQAQVEAAKAAIAAAKAQIQADQAAVETATINLGFTQMTSPIDGIAGAAQAQVGDLVSTSSAPLTTVSSVDPIRDYFSVSEQEYLELQKRFSSLDPQRWKLQLILADKSTYPQDGAFYFADRAVDQNTGAIQLAGLFPNPGNILRPGQYGKVRAIVRDDKAALLVPQAAVTELQGSDDVTVVGTDNKVSIRPVRMGERVGMLWVVLEGLEPGERVAVEGQQNLRPGMAVQTKPFEGNQE